MPSAKCGIQYEKTGLGFIVITEINQIWAKANSQVITELSTDERIPQSGKEKTDHNIETEVSEGMKKRKKTETARQRPLHKRKMIKSTEKEKVVSLQRCRMEKASNLIH
jgi:hypothetical protein